MSGVSGSSRRSAPKSLSQNQLGGIQRPEPSHQAGAARPNSFGTCSKCGLTAVEVVVSTMLASMLMVAVLGVLRGLKAQEAALDNRMPVEVWQRTLDRVLQHDLENSRSYELTARSLILEGFGGRDPETGAATWQPVTIVYEIVQDGHRTWLVRRETTTPGGQGPRELVLANVSSIRAGVMIDSGESVPRPLPTSTRNKLPISDGLVLEFWSDDKGPVYGYHFRRP